MMIASVVGTLGLVVLVAAVVAAAVFLFLKHNPAKAAVIGQAEQKAATVVDSAVKKL